jgi:DNA-binding MarR family transcriptional regulator
MKARDDSPSDRLGVKEIKQCKAKKPIEETFKTVARQAHVAPQVLRGADRRWEVTKKRAQAVALLIREYRYRVSEVAEYLGRDQAHISTMLSRLGARESHWD